MFKSLVVLAVVSTMSGPAFAQATQNQTQPNPQAQAAAEKPQTVKKRVCQVIEDENPYSRLGNRKICKTVEVPVPPTGGQSAQQSPAPADPKAY